MHTRCHIKIEILDSSNFFDEKRPRNGQQVIKEGGVDQLNISS